MTGLTRSTVSAIVGELKASGILIERGLQPAQPRGGRPAVDLSLRHEGRYALGVDFGHTHVQVGLSDLDLNIVAKRFRTVDVDHNAFEAIGAAAEMASELLAEKGVDRRAVVGVGIGVPGPVDHAHGFVGSKTILPGWVGLRVADEMERRFELPVEIDNDANLGALAELSLGAARGASDVIYIKASTGIGAGIILGGRLHRGVSGTAGEIGHMTIDENGALCHCGNRGCLETVAGGPAILRLVRQNRPDVSFTTVLKLAAEGDPVCGRAIFDSGRQIGVAIAGLCNLINPERVVVGGLISRAGDILLDAIWESVRRCAVSAAVEHLTIVPATLLDSAELMGALALVARGPNPVFADRIFAPMRGGA